MISFKRVCNIYLVLVYLFSLVTINGYTFSHNHEESCRKDLFEENKNQWDSKAKFKVDINDGLHLFLERNGFTYLFRDIEALRKLHGHNHDSHNGAVNNDEETGVRYHSVQLKFKESNESCNISSKGPSLGHYNYILGNDPSKWAFSVKRYEEITYENLYNGIDVRMYCGNANLKYDFVVKSGANPAHIKINYQGATSLSLNNGKLLVKTTLGTIEESIPLAYQMIDGQLVKVRCEYDLEGNDLKFTLPEGYNRKYDLIIDPEIVASTYSGSTSDNWGMSATYDAQGNIYIGGTIDALGYPTTVGAYKEDFGGGPGNPGFKTQADGVISKFNADGTQLIYATYLGGKGVDRPQSLVVNDAGELYVYGATNSEDFPMTTSDNSFDKTYNGEFDIYVAKFNADGTDLIGSTFLGGTGNDGICENPGLEPAVLNSLHYNYGDNARGEVQVGKDGSVYVVSSTSSADFPNDNGLYPNISGGQDACVVKLDSNLKTVLWSTYFGGIEDDGAFSMFLDAQDNIYFTGGTKSANLQVSADAFNTVFGGSVDGYVASISSDGTSFNGGTFVGTEDFDQCYFIHLDRNEDIYLFGLTKGTYPINGLDGGPIFSNANSRQFLHKLSKDFTESKFSTVFGNGDDIPNISPTAFMVDTCDNIYFSGYGRAKDGSRHIDGGNTLNMPVTNDALQQNTDGRDFYFLILSRNAEAMVYGSYFGEQGITDHVDGGTSRFDQNGVIYQAICACGTARGLQTNATAAFPEKGARRGCNTYALKFYMDRVQLSAEALVSSVDGCVPFTVTFQNGSSGAVDYIWDFGDGSPISTEFEPTHEFTEAKEYTVTLIAIDSSKCIIADTAQVTVRAEELDIEVEDEEICFGDTVMLNVKADADIFQWTPPEGLSNAQIKNPIASPKKTTVYSVYAKKGFCERTAQVTVTVIPSPIADFLPNPNNVTTVEDPIFKFIDLSIDGTIGTWEFGDGSTAVYDAEIDEIEHEYVVDNNTMGPHVFYVKLILTNDLGCNDTIVRPVIIKLYNSIYVPNVFTPNGDGLNDRFYAFGTGIIDFEMTVFNRWGEVIYRSNDINEGWDGTVRNSNDLTKQDVYVWKIRIQNNEGKKGTFLGHVTLTK